MVCIRRLVDKLQTIITGMTRDGFFLIEDGEVVRGLRNMRFNESIIGSLGPLWLAKELVRSESHRDTCHTPARSTDSVFRAARRSK